MKDAGKAGHDAVRELEDLCHRLEAQIGEKSRDLSLAREQLKSEVARRRQLELELRDSEEKYRSIFDNSIDGLLLTSPDGSIFAANRTACEMLGRTEQELRELGRCGILDDADPAVAAFLAERLQTGRYLGELRHKRKDGSLFPVELSSSLFRLSNGELRASLILRDITARRQAEAKLKESEERLQFALRGADLGMWDWNIVTGKLVVNDRWAEMLGYSREEIEATAHMWESLMHPDDRPRVQAALQAHLDGKTAYYETEHRLRTKAGGWLWILDKGAITHRDNAGRPLRAVGTHLDITDRKRAETALRDSEEKYRRIFENELIAIHIYDLATLRFLDVNDTHVRLYGYSREELLQGMTILDISAESEASIESARQEQAQSTIHVPVRYHKKKDGTVFPVELFGGRYLLNGRGVRFGMVRDITNRMRREETLRKSEERLALALQATQDAVWDWDLQADTLYYSPRWWRMLGYEPQEEYVNVDRWSAYVHPDDMDRAVKTVTRALEDQDSYEMELRLKHKQGHYVPVRTRGIILRDADHKPIRVSGANTDLTEQKRIEEERRQWQRNRQQFQKAESLNRMAAAIAHNFNNLLGSVIGCLDLAKEDLPKDTRLRTNIEEALRSSQRAAEVSGLMLTYLGKMAAKMEVLDLVHAFRHALPALRRSLSAEVSLEAELPDSDVVVPANPSQLHQVMRSLVVNAAEAIGNTRGTIRIRIGTVPAAHIRTAHRFPVDWQPQQPAYACLSVQDSGCGISEKELEQIFDPFYSTKFVGRGLGLSVALGIIRAHQGGFAVESAPGQGSTFHVYLPVSAQPISFHEEKEIPAAVLPDATAVLLVDDDEPMRRMAARMLGRMGFPVLEAIDGVEAVEVFRQHHAQVRLVVLDLTMPRMNGWDALNAIRAIRPGVPVILVSGYDEARVMQGDHPELPQAFLHKPYRREDLAAALDAAQKAGTPPVSP